MDLAGEGRESGLIGMGLAGEGQAKQSAAMKGVLETQGCRATSVSARDFHGVLYGFNPSIYQ